MGDTTTCRKCGTELPSSSVQEFCAVCDPTPAAGHKVADKTVVVQQPARPVVGVGTPGVQERYFGDYELLDEIAQGGMGIVYKARQISLNRVVALKMILWGQYATEADVKRFLSEAQAASNLDHPNIVPIFEVGEIGGRHYFSMRFIDGGGLDEQVEKYQKDARLAARLVSTVARAVHFAHQRGILHRDLKPANILLDTHGQPYVTDFGLAKRVKGDSNITHAGVIMGSPNYMSPEQAAGDKNQLTTGTDVYSLGAILYLLLTGKAPFESDTPMETLRRLAQEEARAPRELNPGVDRELETICLKCLEKDPRQRYGSAEALADDLEHWRKGEPIAARPVGYVGRTIKWTKRRPAAAALVGVVVAAVAASVVIYGLRQAELKRQNYLLSMKEKEAREALALATNALAEAKEAKKESEQDQRDMRQLVVNRETGTALGTLDSGDAGGSLVWLAEALRIEDMGKAPLDQNQRMRFGAILQLCPRLAGFWSGEGVVVANVASPNGDWVATFSGKERDGRPPDGRPPEGGFGRNRKKGPPPGGGPMRTRPPDGEQLEGRLWDMSRGALQSATFASKIPVFHAGLSPDGTWIATATESNIVQVFRLKTGEALGAPMVCAGEVKSVTFSPDGGHLMTLSTGKGTSEVRVWNATTGEAAAPGMPADEKIDFAMFSPDGRELLTANESKLVRLWGLPWGRKLAEFHPTGRINCAAFSPDGVHIATGSSDHYARIWDKTTGEQFGKELVHNFPVMLVTFSPDGRRLVTANSDNTTRIWEIVGSTAEPLGAAHHNARVLEVRFSADAREYLTVTETTARLWCATNGLPATPPLVSHADVLHVGLDDDGRQLLMISRDQTARLWDMASSRQMPSIPLRHNKTVNMVAFSPDNKYVVTAGADGVAMVWEADNGRLLHTLPHKGPVKAAQFTADGQRIVTVSGDNPRSQKVEVWGVTNGAAFPKQGHARELVALSPDGKWYAAVDGEKPPRPHDTITDLEMQPTNRSVGKSGPFAGKFAKPSGKLRPMSGKTPDFPGKPAQLAISASGRQIAELVTNENGPGFVRVWDGNTEQPSVVRIPLKPDEHILCLAVSPDGKRVAVGTDANHGLVFIPGAPGRPPESADGPGGNAVKLEHSGDVVNLAFSPDGHWIVTASADDTARVWDAVTGQPRTPFLAHESRVTQAVFSRDGQRVLTASWDGTARVWDAQTGYAITPPLGHSQPVDFAAFSADGNAVATAGEDGTARIWNLAPVRQAPPQIAQLAQLLSGRTIDNVLSLVPVSREQFKQAWEALKGHGIPRLVASAVNTETWHRRLADECEAEKDWYGETVHLERLLKTKPADAELQARLKRVQQELAKLQAPPAAAEQTKAPE